MKGFVAPLVFPLVFTAWEFIRLTNNPLGSFGSLGYSQYGNLPLMQLVSITGIWGLTFIVCWFAATVNWAWGQHFSWPRVRRGILAYGAVIGLVLLYGGARLAFAPAAGGTVRIASFTAVDGRSEVSFSLIRKDREAFRQVTKEFHERYVAETRRQADAGADLILWPELAGIVLGEDESDMLERVRKLAREEDIYLVVPFFTMHKERGRPPENKLLAFDPTGETVLEHYKYGGNIVEGSVEGDGVLQTFQAPFATVSGVICWDMDFPRTISQASRNGTDILSGSGARLARRRQHTWTHGRLPGHRERGSAGPPGRQRPVNRDRRIWACVGEFGPLCGGQARDGGRSSHRARPDHLFHCWRLVCMDYDLWILGDCVGDDFYGPQAAACELSLPSL